MAFEGGEQGLVLGPVFHSRHERLKRGYSGDVEPLALFSRLDRDGAKALRIDAVCIRAYRRDGYETRYAHLGSHADHKIRRIAFQRGKQQHRTARDHGRPATRHETQGTAILAYAEEHRFPFPVDGVENPHGRIRTQPQYGAEVTGMVSTQRDFPLREKRGGLRKIDINSRTVLHENGHITLPGKMLPGRKKLATIDARSRAGHQETSGRFQTMVPCATPSLQKDDILPAATPHTDIKSDGWVARMPVWLRPYLLLARLDRPVGTWLLLLPGLWGIELGTHHAFRRQIELAILFAVGSLAMRSAGCVVNDIWDRDIDAKVERTAGRPLASGALSVRQALVFLCLLLLIGLGVLLALPLLCWALAPVALLLVALYPAAKRVTWWPQLVMGFTFGFGAPMGYAAAANRLDMTALTLYAGTILWQLGFDTIYGFQDMDDDARIGVRSTSRLMVRHARLFVGTCYALAMLLFIAAGCLCHMGIGFWPGAVAAAIILAAQIRVLQTDQPALCLHLFRRNVPFGAVLAFAYLMGNMT